MKICVPIAWAIATGSESLVTNNENRALQNAHRWRSAATTIWPPPFTGMEGTSTRWRLSAITIRSASIRRYRGTVAWTVAEPGAIDNLHAFLSQLTAAGVRLIDRTSSGHVALLEEAIARPGRFRWRSTTGKRPSRSGS